MADTNINNNYFKKMIPLLDERDIPTTATSKSCAWQNYEILIFCLVHYGNIRASIIAPKSYFQNTHSSGRVILIDSSGSDVIPRYSIYQNGSGSVYVEATISSSDNFGIRIYGIN